MMLTFISFFWTLGIWALPGLAYSSFLFRAALGAGRGRRSAWFTSIIMLALNILLLATTSLVVGHRESMGVGFIPRVGATRDTPWSLVVALVVHACIFVLLLAREREFTSTPREKVYEEKRSL